MILIMAHSRDGICNNGYGVIVHNEYAWELNVDYWVLVDGTSTLTEM